MFYLETNGIRAISDQLIKKNLYFIYTSYKVVYELFSGIATDNEYFKRLPFICKLEKVKIDWESPRKKMLKAFGINTIDDTDSKRLFEIFNLVINNKDKIVIEKLLILIKYLVDNDCDICSCVLEANYDDIKDYAKDIKGKPIRDILINDDYFNPIVQNVTEIEIVNIAKMIADEVKCSYKDLIIKYDGNLDNFIKATIAIGLKARFSGSPMQKNDGHDFQHLLYLKKGDILVSDDKLFKRIEKYCMVNTIKISEWINEIRKDT